MMKNLLILLMLFLFESVFCQQKITGRVISENNAYIPSVLIVNTSNNTSTNSNAIGEFIIEANENDEIRFIKNGYERLIKRVAGNTMTVTMIPIAQEIEEIKILRLTGDLSKDSKKLTKIDKVEELQKSIGLPKPPEIMREKAPELKDAFVIGLPIVVINIDALYKVISGDSRRMKAQYKYDDLQRLKKWLNTRIDPEYFVSAGIPENKINEFLDYAFAENPQSLYFLKKKNISGAIFEIDKTIPKFVERLNNEK